MMKKLLLFTVAIFLMDSCGKQGTDVANLTPQEDSLKKAMANLHTYDEIKKTGETLKAKDTITTDLLQSAAPKKLLGMKRDTLEMLENYDKAIDWKIKSLGAQYSEKNKQIQLNIADGAGNTNSDMIENTMVMEGDYINKKLENGWRKSILYKRKIIWAEEKTEGGTLKSELKFQLRKRYFVDVYGTNIPVKELKKVIIEIDSTKLPD